jgi:hypothetical protein
MKRKVVIDSCASGLSREDDRFIREYQEIRCNDITGNGCHLEVHRLHQICVDDEGNCYPDDNDAYYLGENHAIKTKEQVDSLNQMMEDFFTRNEIEGDSFLLYVSW